MPRVIPPPSSTLCPISQGDLLSAAPKSEVFASQSSSAALPVLLARCEVFVRSTAALCLPSGAFRARQFCSFCLKSCTGKISRQCFQNTARAPLKQRSCPGVSSAAPPSVGGFGHPPGALQCPSSTPAQPSPNKQSSRGPLASSASSHQVTELAAFLCDSQLCPDLSLHCSSLLQDSSNHLGRPQQITGFPTHRAQPLIPNFIHYNALIITLRLPKFPAQEP